MNGKIISIGNFKGGVGKTLISYLLYKHFQNDYELIQSDLDFINNNVIHIRDKQDFIQKGNEIKEILSKKNLLIDTGGFLDDLQTYFFIRSNLLIIPLFLDSINIKRTFLFLKFVLENIENNNNVKLKKENILIVINKYNNKQEKTKNDFVNYVKDNFNINNFFTLNDYKSYVKSIDNNVNLIELNNKNKILYTKPKNQLLELNEIIQKILKGEQK